MKKYDYIPLFIIEGYLILTILLLLLGPLQFKMHNEPMFWFLIFMYHMAFIFGYLLQGKMKLSSRMCAQLPEGEIKRRYTLGLILSFFVWIVFTRINTKSASYLPFDLFENAIVGLINPSVRYHLKFSSMEAMQFQNEPMITAMVILFYFIYYCLPAFLLIYWNYITKLQKIFSVGIIILSVLVGFSVGTNSLIFHEIFALIGGFLIRNYSGAKFHGNRKLFLLIGILVFCGMLYFSHNLLNRLAGQENEFYTKVSNDITISESYEFILEYSSSKIIVGALSALEYYVCQGYYGMSLALEKEFTSTYGLGHSFYLIKKFDKMFSTDIFARTYQSKVDDVWSSSIQWHSWYGQMANDVSFIGVIAVMFALGYIVSMAWRDVLYRDNFFAKCLCVLFVPLVVFMPANNLVGNLTGTFFAFWEVVGLWLISRKARIRLGGLIS